MAKADYAERKKVLRENNSLVVRPIGRLDAGIVGKTRRALSGSQKKFTPTRMKNGINKYFQWCEEQDELPSIKGMMLHLGMGRDQFYQYLKYPEFAEIMEQSRMIISLWAENDVYNAKGMAAGRIAYMKNVHGWSEKVESSNTTVRVDLTPEQARARIESLAPKLLEVLQSNYTVQQIVHQPQPKEA